MSRCSSNETHEYEHDCFCSSFQQIPRSISSLHRRALIYSTGPGNTYLSFPEATAGIDASVVRRVSQ